MCNLGTAIENKGIETGIEIGEKKKAKEDNEKKFYNFQL